MEVLFLLPPHSILYGENIPSEAAFGGYDHWQEKTWVPMIPREHYQCVVKGVKVLNIARTHQEISKTTFICYYSYIHFEL